MSVLETELTELLEKVKRIQEIVEEENEYVDEDTWDDYKEVLGV